MNITTMQLLRNNRNEDILFLLPMVIFLDKAGVQMTGSTLSALKGLFLNDELSDFSELKGKEDKFHEFINVAEGADYSIKADDSLELRKLARILESDLSELKDVLSDETLDDRHPVKLDLCVYAAVKMLQSMPTLIKAFAYILRFNKAPIEGPPKLYSIRYTSSIESSAMLTADSAFWMEFEDGVYSVTPVLPTATRGGGVLPVPPRP